MSSSYFKLSKALRARLQQALQPGETVMWAGTPDWRAKWSELVAISLFALFWNAIAGTFVVLAAAAALGLVPPGKMNGFATSWGPYVVLVFMVPFVVIGAVLVWHVLKELRSGKRRVHAVTDCRVLTVELGQGKPLEDRLRTEINFVRSAERADGSGTITIAVGVVRDLEGDPRPETLTWPGIPDVAYVQAILDRRTASTVSATTRAAEQTVVPEALRGLSPVLARACERETRGERIAWIGQPDAKTAAILSMLVWIVAVPWLYYAVRLQMFGLVLVFDEGARAASKTPFFIAGVTALFGLPFVAVGLSMLGLPARAWRWARSTVHIITDRRVVSVRRRRGQIAVASIEPSRIVSVSRSGKGARGTIRIVMGKTKDSDGDITDLAETFWMVEDAERAERLIEGLRGDSVHSVRDAVR